MLALIVPSLLPPPAPFKIFVLLAGVAGIAAQHVRRRRSPSAAASGTSARGCSRSGTASRRSTSSTRTAGRSRSGRSASWCSSVGLAGSSGEAQRADRSSALRSRPDEPVTRPGLTE